MLIALLQANSCQEALQKASDTINQELIIIPVLVVSCLALGFVMGWLLRRSFKNCPRCRSLVVSTGTICKKCGRDLPLAGLSTPPPPN